MEATLPLRTDGPVAVRARTGLLRSLPLLSVLVWHGWMTLSLFGPVPPWQHLFNNGPILSGRHALHLYHGFRVARAFHDRGAICSFDPAFQAGYPITPVFDEGARPAALFLTLAGAEFRPAAYKAGFALCCFLAPLLLLMAARGAGLGMAGCTLASAASLLVWWSTPCRQLLEAGDLDLILSGSAVVAGAGMLIAYHYRPGFSVWLGVVAAGCVGWFGQPLLFITFFVLAFVYYISVGTRHRFGWHVALLCAFAAPVALHGFWLADWLNYWWIRSPLLGDAPILAHATFHTLWTAPLWGDRADRLVAAALFVLAVVGLGAFNETDNRPAARVFGTAAVGFSILALAGAVCEPLARLGTGRLLVIALWCAAVPAAYALTQTASFLVRISGSPLRAGAVIAGSVAMAAAFAVPSLRTLAVRYSAAAPLQIGFTPEQLGWVRAIQENTTAEARILWEEADDEPGSGWTALLPLLTDRSYIGGLDASASVEYNYARLGGHFLAGRPMDSWSEPELRDFYRRYNIGWVVCSSRAARACLQDYEDGQPILFVEGNDQRKKKDPRYLYQLKQRSYVLRGQGRLIEADTQHITLADVAPAEDGKVVLSMHYHAGMRVSPSRVQIEQESDPRDPIDFIRLKLQGPVARVTITWQPGK